MFAIHGYVVERRKAPASSSGPHSGTPLWKKLGLKPGGTLALSGAPSGLAEASFGDLPTDSRLLQRAAGEGVALSSTLAFESSVPPRTSKRPSAIAQSTCKPEASTANGCRKQRAKPNRHQKHENPCNLYFLVRAWSTGPKDQDDSQSPWEWHF